MKKILFFIILITAVRVTAQNDVDALRYSNLTFGGTARFNGMAGAFGALGGDFSTLSVNPAGIGVYKSSEFTFSPSLFVGKTSSDYNGSVYDDLKYNFNVGNAGFVLSYPTKNDASKPGWRNVQFGFGINRSSNYNNRILLEGNNTQSSLADTWVSYANGNTSNNLNGFDTELGYYTYAIDTVPGSTNQYVSNAPKSGVIQRKAIEMAGSMNEWVLSMGANYDDKLYIGATVGFPFIRYSEQSTYTEMAMADSIAFNEYRRFDYHSDLVTNGSGINFKLGMIFKLVDFLRIGVAMHTPTYFYNMKDTYSNSASTKFDNGDAYERNSPEGKFDYNLTTPMRVIGSLAFVIGKIGLVSADYEFVDYSSARLRSDHPEDFFLANDQIRNKYTTAGNLRLGTEWRIDQFSLRGGYAMYDSPFKSGINDGKRTAVTFGLGLKQADYFLDFAYVYQQSKEDYYLYDPDIAPVNPVSNTITSHSYMLTLGFKF